MMSTTDALDRKGSSTTAVEPEGVRPFSDKSPEAVAARVVACHRRSLDILGAMDRGDDMRRPINAWVKDTETGVLLLLHKNWLKAYPERLRLTTEQEVETHGAMLRRGCDNEMAIWKWFADRLGG